MNMLPNSIVHRHRRSLGRVLNHSRSDAKVGERLPGWNVQAKQLGHTCRIYGYAGWGA
jgi:hypothetical protein